MHISTETITNCKYIVKLIVYNRRKMKKCDHLREKCDRISGEGCKTLQYNKMQRRMEKENCYLWREKIHRLLWKRDEKVLLS